MIYLVINYKKLKYFFGKLNTVLNLQTSTMNNNFPVICIPMVFMNISTERIENVLQNQLGLGTVRSIELVPQVNSVSGKPFQTAYVKIQWNVSITSSVQVRDLLLSGKQVQVVYDKPWFWWLRASTSNEDAPEPYVNFGADSHPPSDDVHQWVNQCLDEYEQDRDETEDDFLRDIEHINRGGSELDEEIENDIEEILAVIN
jgi:hypothetical protein